MFTIIDKVTMQVLDVTFNWVEAFQRARHFKNKGYACKIIENPA